MALNFPNEGLTVGQQYTGDNGVVYIYDGVKWVGNAPANAAGTNSIINGSNVVQVDGDGNLVIPVGAIIKDAAGDPVGGSSDRLVNGDYEVVLGSSGNITIPKNSSITLPESTDGNRYGGDISIMGQRGYGNWSTEGNAGWGSSIYIRSGDGGENNISDEGGEGGEVWIRSGDGQAGENGGTASLIAGDAKYNNSTSTVYGGNISVRAGNATDSTSGLGQGGNVNIIAGQGDQANGVVNITTQNSDNTDNTWEFAGGVLTLPGGNTRIGDISGGGIQDFIIGSTGTLLGVVVHGETGAGALQWVDNFENLGTTSTEVAAVIVNSPFASTTGTVQILTGISNGFGSSNTWEFDVAGVLHLPETSDIKRGGISVLQSELEIDGGNANTPELGELIIDGNNGA